MSNLKEQALNLSKYIAQIITRTAITHKKKLIAAVLLLIAGFIAKKKLTMAHIISAVQALSRFIQYLPLPQSPKLRQLSPYEHPTPSPLKGIIEAIRLEQIKSRIQSKSGSFQELKDSILTGAMLTLTLYNPNGFYFVLQNKYSEQFKALQASSQLDQAMFLIRKSFIDEIPLIFEHTQRTIQTQLNQIDLHKLYDINELASLFKTLTSTIFQAKFERTSQQKRSIISKIEKKQPAAASLFTTHYEYTPKKKSNLIVSILLETFRFMGGVLSITDLFPKGQQQVTSQRYEFIRKSYLQAILKADLDSIQWPSEQSSSLFALVGEQAKYTLLTLNFSLLCKEYSHYMSSILLNRLRLWMASNKLSSTKMLKLLPALYKILKQQFFKSEILQLRQVYHEKEVKRSIRQISPSSNENSQSMQTTCMEQHILEQVRSKKVFQYVQKQFQLKFFNERSGVVHRVKKQQSEGKQSQQMEKLLGMLRGSDALNQPA